MTTATLNLVVALKDQASAGLNKLSGGVSDLGDHFKDLAKTGLVAATGALVGFGAAAGKVAFDGLRLNSSMENVSAQLLAFTKDGALAASILEDIRIEASKTPFAFEEMARATASLLPAAKASGLELMDLVKQAEILAALNPAEGLEGAAFALKEALSGDFVSIVERFNLPRQRLKELKDQGVPAMEAISIALQEMGIDASLVAGMAETMTGRWSTFMDTVDTAKAAFSKPIFDLLKRGLERLQPVLDANMDRIVKFAEEAGGRLARALESLANNVLPVAVHWFGLIRDAVTTFQEAWAGDWVDSDIINPLHRLVGIATTLFRYFQTAVEDGEPLNDFLANLPKPLQDVAYAIGSLIDTLQEGGIRGLLESMISPEWMTVLDNAAISIGKLAESFVAFATSEDTVNTLKAIGDTIGGLATRLGEFVAHNPQTIINWLTGIAIAIGSFTVALTVVGAVNAFTIAIGTMLASVAASGGILAVVGGTLAGLATPLLILPILLGLLYVAWNENWGGIQEKTTEVVGTIMGEMEKLAELNGGKWPESWDEFTRRYLENLELIRIGTVQFFIDVRDKIAAALETAKQLAFIIGTILASMPGIQAQSQQLQQNMPTDKGVGGTAPKPPGAAPVSSLPPSFPTGPGQNRRTTLPGMDQQSTAAGAPTGGGVVQHLHFYGNVDRAEVAAGAEQGVKGALRARGTVYS